MKKINKLAAICLGTMLTFSLTGCVDKETSGKAGSESSITVGDEFKLKGMLTLPENAEKPPVVILVQGSGQSDMNETIIQNKPFKDIANGLAKEGIATIRYNKRFYQHQDKAGDDITIQNEIIDDVNNAIELAKKDDRLDSSKIYVAGHSLGGMVAPEIAKNNKDVKGIISLAGSPRNLIDIIISQNKDVIDAMTDKTDAEKEALLKDVKAQLEPVKEFKDGDEKGETLNVPNGYWISLNKLNIPETLKSLDIPMLFLQGEADFQATAAVDFQAYKDILKDSENATFKLYPNLNHLFMPTQGKLGTAEYEKKGTVDSVVTTDMAEWIKSQK